MNLAAHRLQMVTTGHLFAVEVNGSWWGHLIFVRRTADFIKHRHVLMLVLHARSAITLFIELLCLLDASRERPDVFL